MSLQCGIIGLANTGKTTLFNCTYDLYADDIRSLAVTADGAVTVGDIADVLPSRMRNYILIRIKPFSETRILV